MGIFRLPIHHESNDGETEWLARVLVEVVRDG